MVNMLRKHYFSRDQHEDESKDSGGYIVDHDSPSLAQGFQSANWPGLHNIEETEEEDGGQPPVEGVVRERGDGAAEQYNPLAHGLIDDNKVRVFLAGDAGQTGGGRNTDRKEKNCSKRSYRKQDRALQVQQTNRSQPKEPSQH